MESEFKYVTAKGENAAEKFAKDMLALHPTEEDLARASKFLVAEVKQNALFGMNYRGTPFAPYSPQYAKRKHSNHVDLYGEGRDGHMLDAIGANIQLEPPAIEVGIFDDPVLASRARWINEGVVFAGRQARAFIKSVHSRSRQKIAGWKREYKNRKYVTVIPKREFLGIRNKLLGEMSKVIVDNIFDRLQRGK